MEGEPTEFVAQPALAEVVRAEPEERREVGSQVAGGETGRLEPEDDERGEERLGPLIGEPHRLTVLSAAVACPHAGAYASPLTT